VINGGVHVLELRLVLAGEREAVHQPLPNSQRRVSVFNGPIGLNEFADRRRDGCPLHSCQQRYRHQEDCREFESSSVHVSKDGEDERKLALYTILNNAGEGAESANLLFGGWLLQIPGDEKSLGTAPDQRGEAVIGQQAGRADASEAVGGAFHKHNKTVAFQNEVGADFCCGQNVDASRGEALELLLDHIL